MGDGEVLRGCWIVNSSVGASSRPVERTGGRPRIMRDRP